MRPYEFFLYVAVIVGWSTSWYPLSLQLGVVAPEVSLVWRFSISGLMMFGICALSGIDLRFGRAEHGRFLMLGMALFSTNFALFYNASLYAASGLLAVMLSMASLINVGLAAVVNRRPPPLLQVVAALTGLAGLGLVFLPELQMSSTVLTSMAFGFAGTISFCIGNMMSSASQGRGIHVLASTSWGMIYGTGFMVLVALARGHDFIIDPSVSYLGSLAWLIVVSSVMTFACYLSLIGRIGPGRAAYATVVFPIFALLISARYEGYEWTLPSLAGMGLVVVGNLMMIRARD
ncbi:MAG: EamA family transporter [SAR116 cluster bacterium]|nr:EamA family transporter [SAR116 cluster bacterium]RPH00478.1 MAG: DMT family transporter [Candidatus Puniceispirillum sp. TMED176]|tara:strand:+ start:4552 stop:5421 length:870 start_codon:yes stop_codon:yes gene_type:complete